MSITATYVSSTSFTVVGDKTAEFNVGRRNRTTYSGSYSYGTVVSSSYSSPNTTVTIEDDTLTSAMTAVEYGVQADDIGSMPDHTHDSTEGEGGAIEASSSLIEKLNGPTYDNIQEWLNNTQSAGRMSGGITSTHTDSVTGVTVGGAGSGEFKVAGDQTAGYAATIPLRVTDSTNNDGYYTVKTGGSSYSAGTTTIPVDEAVAATADGNIVNGTVDVATGTGFIKTTDSDIGDTKSFDLAADTNITLTNLFTNYLYVDYNAGTPDIKNTTDRSSIEKNRQFPLSMVYRNGARTWICSCGIYLPNKTRLDHERILTLRGYERASGAEVSEYGTRNIQSTNGVFFRGSNEVDITSKASATDKLTTIYYDGSNWVWTENQTQIDNTYYNNIATGLVALSNNAYGVNWVCIDYLGNLYMVYGRNSYTLPQAELAGVPSLMPVVADEFGIVAAKIIIQEGASSFVEVISAYTQLVPSPTPSIHNNLSGLNDGDYKHLTATEYGNIDGAATATSNGYATSNQIDKLDGIADSADVTGSNPPQAHTHDDRYYTETEVDSSLAGKSDTSHTHDARYYTETETDTWRSSTTQTEMGYVHGVTSDIQTQLGTKSATDHTHTEANITDLDKYTQAEVDTISGSLNDKIGGGLDNIVEDTTPELGGSLGVGEYGIKLDSLLSADGKYSGITCDGVLGATLAFGDLVYLSTANQRWANADADAEATSGDVMLAIVLAGGNGGDTRLLLLRGFVREDDWNFTSYGQALFVSNTAGNMSQTAPSATGDIVRVVGYAGTTADQIYFSPDNTWIEIG